MMTDAPTNDVIPVGLDEARKRREVRKERVHLWPLLVIASLGAGLVGSAIYLDLWLHMSNILPSVYLEVGAGALLFALLFWAERRFIRREVVVLASRAVVEELNAQRLAEIAKDPAAVELADAAEIPGSQVHVAMSFVAAMGVGRFEEGWELADSNWRLCRVQHWLWNNRREFGEDREILDELASDILSGSTGTGLWESFAQIEQRAFEATWGPYTKARLAPASRRRRVGPAHEVIILVPLREQDQGFIVNGPVMLHQLRLLVVSTGQGFRVASHAADAAPLPGYPPTWWSVER